MTSQINFSAINAAYPVAGVDNNSQGFRDNFTAISAGLATAKSEITALNARALLSASLTAPNAAVVNNLNGSTLRNGKFSQFSAVYYSGGTIAATANIDLANGPAQKFVLSGNATLTFTGWPSVGQMGLVRVLIASDQAGVRSPSLATSGGGSINYERGYPLLPNTTSFGFHVGGESVASVLVNTPGSGYLTPTTVSFTSATVPGGRVPQATATYKVLSATPTAGSLGTGFAIGDLVVINQDTKVTLQVTGVTSGQIASVSPIPHSALLAPFAGSLTVTALTGIGTGARIDTVCGIDTVVLTDSGDGYASIAPIVTIAAPNAGVQATASATLTLVTGDNVKVIEAWTIDAGATVFVRYIGEYA